MIKATKRYANINLKALSRIWKYHALYEPAEKAPHYFDEYHRAVISFLSKLSSNPEKETVKWPNRSEEIKKLAISTIKGINYDDFDGEQEKLIGYLSVFHGDRPSSKTQGYPSEPHPDY